MNHKSVRASNVKVLGTNIGSDSGHVKRMSPMDRKTKEMKAATALGIDARREKSTSRKRKDKEVKPL